MIAIAGGGRRELLEKPISQQLSEILEERALYRHMGGSGVSVSEADEKFVVSVAAPVISEGDVMGGVLFVAPKDAPAAGEIEYRLAQTVAAFLGKQMES